MVYCFLKSTFTESTSKLLLGPPPNAERKFNLDAWFLESRQLDRSKIFCMILGGYTIINFLLQTYSYEGVDAKRIFKRG